MHINRNVDCWWCMGSQVNVVMICSTPAALSAKQGMLRIKKLKEDAEVEVKDEKKEKK